VWRVAIAASNKTGDEAVRPHESRRRTAGSPILAPRVDSPGARTGSPIRIGTGRPSE
jgi:hypothetical protein